MRRRHARRCRPAEVEDPITHEGIASEPGRSRVWPGGSVPCRSASGRREAVADDERTREVRPGRSSGECAEQSRASGGGGAGAKGRDRGEGGPARHAPGAEPGGREPSVGPSTASREAKEEGTVHRAASPRQPRQLAAGVSRAQARRRPGRRRYDVARVRGRAGAPGSQTCTAVFIAARIARRPRAGRIYRRRMAASGRWPLPPWKTRSSRAPPSWC